MKNRIIPPGEQEAIKSQVQKVLRGLGNPKPPLKLAEVRALLELDRHYYSSMDDSATREFISKIRVGAKQLINRPTLLFDVIKKADLSALWLPDRRRILLDQDQPKLKHRWNEAHEIIHSQLPWHQAFTLGDSQRELSLDCREEIEAEANFGAGQLLFLLGDFRERARSTGLSLESVFTLADTYGNTKTSTLWRYSEEACSDLPIVAIVSKHPFHPTGGIDPRVPCKRCVESETFKAQFGDNSEMLLYGKIGDYCSGNKTGPLGESEIILTDNNGADHLFHFKSFGTKYYVLTLAVHLRKMNSVISVSKIRI